MVVGAVLGVSLAIVLPSIILALQIFYTIMAVAITAPLIVGLYSERPKAARAIIAIVASVGITAVTRSAPNGLVVGFGIMLLP